VGRSSHPAADVHLLLVVVDPKLASGTYLRPDAAAYLVQVVALPLCTWTASRYAYCGGSDNLNHLFTL
jgi:hypothetical protein